MAAYPKFDGKPVTRTFSRLLWDCRHHGWQGALTSGKRSRAKQLALYVGYWVKHLPGFNPANPPDKSAHCRNGWRCAVDVTRPDQFMEIARKRGWPVVRPYSHEPWHVELRYEPKTMLGRLAAERRKAKAAKIQPTRLSQRGLDLIAGFEGLRLTSYHLAGEKYWTIGYGHYGPDVKPGVTISKTRALELLRVDVGQAEQTVAGAVKVPLTQAQFDALVSFTFNVGAAAFKGSTLLRKLNAKDYAGAAGEFVRWDKDSRGQSLAGLKKRRADERALFAGVK